MSPVQASRAIGGWKFRFEMAGVRLASFFTPLINSRIEEGEKINPWELFPSKKLKPESVKVQEKEEYFNKTVEKMGVNSIPPGGS